MDRLSGFINDFWASALLQATELPSTDARVSKGARRVVAVSDEKNAAADNWHMDGLQGPLFAFDSHWASEMPITDQFFPPLNRESRSITRSESQRGSNLWRVFLALMILTGLALWSAPPTINLDAPSAAHGVAR